MSDVEVAMSPAGRGPGLPLESGGFLVEAGGLLLQSPRLLLLLCRLVVQPLLLGTEAPGRRQAVGCNTNIVKHCLQVWPLAVTLDPPTSRL